MIKIDRKRCILAVVILAAAAVCAVFLNTLFGYLPVIAFAAAICISRLYLGGLKKALEFSEESNFRDCVRGERVDFKVHVVNRSRLFFPRIEAFFYSTDLYGEINALTQDSITLAAKEDRTFSFDIRFDHVGVFSAGLNKVVIYDLFGIFSCTYENEKRYEVTVLPKIYDISRLPISEDVQSRNDHSRFSVVMDGSDYTGVREYVPGDPMKVIHWKLSARIEGYLTKQFETNTSVGLCTILDFYSPAYEQDALMSIFDTVLESGVTAHNYARKHGYDSYICFFDRQGIKNKLIEHRRNQMSENIPRMPRVYTEADRGRGIDLLREEGRSYYSMGNIAVCTADISQEMIEALIMLRAQRKNPILFAIIPPETDELEKERIARSLRALDGAGVYYELISDAKEISGGGVLTAAIGE